MSDKIIEAFIEKSEKASNTNKIIAKDEIEKIISQTEYDYIKLNSTTRFNKIPDVGSEGIENAIVEAELGIAETGTVVLTDESENYRRATSLCENLYVIIPASKIVNKLEDSASLLKEITKSSNGGYIAFITGASRTADIEMSLTLGVHGPQTMTVFIINDM